MDIEQDILYEETKSLIQKLFQSGELDSEKMKELYSTLTKENASETTQLVKDMLEIVYQQNAATFTNVSMYVSLAAAAGLIVSYLISEKYGETWIGSNIKQGSCALGFFGLIMLLSVGARHLGIQC